MILSVFNIMIGIGMAAFSAHIGVEVGVSFLEALGINALGASTEFIGDGSQGLIGKAVKKIKQFLREKKLNKALLKSLSKLNEQAIAGKSIEASDLYKTIQVIIKEIYDAEQKDKKEIEKINNAFKKSNLTKVMALLSEELVFFHGDIEELLKKSVSFEKLTNGTDEEKETASVIVELVKLPINLYIKEVYYEDCPEEMKALALIIIQALNDRPALSDEKVKELAKQIVSFLADQNGGVVNVSAIVGAKYAPKYTLRSCPGCGYDGERLLVNEKAGTIQCAACGKTYDLLQYEEPELYAKLMKKVDGKIDELLNESDKNAKNTDKQFDKIKKQLCDANKQNTEIKDQLVKIYQQSVTKDYLASCMKGQTEQLKKDLQDLIKDTGNKFENAFNDKFGDILSSLSSMQEDSTKLKKGQEDILDLLKQKNEDDKIALGHLSQTLDSLDKQVGSLFEYAQKNLGGKADLILEYVQKLCSKEYYEEMTNALGTDLNKAVSFQIKQGYDSVQALTSTGFSQIIAAIDDLKEKCTVEKGENKSVDVSKIEDTIKKENVQLSGQIISLTSLVESNQKENNENFKQIIKSQEEIKHILLATIGANVNEEDFKKMYKGKIPSKYLINKGMSEPFACPYCGAVEAREMNEDQCCQCSVCGHYYLKVDPTQKEGEKTFEEILKNDYGYDESLAEFATKAKIDKWREKHMVKPNGKIIGDDETFPLDGLLILPRDVNNPSPILQENFANMIEKLIVLDGIQTLPRNFFVNCKKLKLIIFQSEAKDGKSSYTSRDVHVSRTVTILGKNVKGQQIRACP